MSALSLLRSPASLLCALLLWLPGVVVQPSFGDGPGPRAPAEPGVPAWFTEHLAERMSGSGRWVADNQAYVSDSEAIDAYGIEWRWGPGKRSIVGRMFAIAGGRENATVWELRTLWHPGRREAQVFQYGSDGTFGEGVMTPDGPGRVRLEQTFHRPDGSSFRMRHEELLDEHGSLVSSSWAGVPEGWEADRTYVWLPRDE